MKRERIEELREHARNTKYVGDALVFSHELEELTRLALRATEPGMVLVAVNRAESWRYSLGKALESLPKGRERDWIWPVWNEIGELDLPQSEEPNHE